jgi:hypothetical protein
MKPMLDGQTLEMARKAGSMRFWDAPDPDARQPLKEE